MGEIKMNDINQELEFIGAAHHTLNNAFYILSKKRKEINEYACNLGFDLTNSNVLLILLSIQINFLCQGALSGEDVELEEIFKIFDRISLHMNDK